jgi:hypothetical protein
MITLPTTIGTKASATAVIAIPIAKTAPSSARIGRRPIRSETGPDARAPATAPRRSTLTTVLCSSELRCRSCFMNSRAPEMIPVSNPKRKLPMLMP